MLIFSQILIYAFFWREISSTTAPENVISKSVSR